MSEGNNSVAVGFWEQHPISNSYIPQMEHHLPFTHAALSGECSNYMLPGNKLHQLRYKLTHLPFISSFCQIITHKTVNKVKVCLPICNDVLRWLLYCLF